MDVNSVIQSLNTDYIKKMTDAARTAASGDTKVTGSTDTFDSIYTGRG